MNFEAFFSPWRPYALSVLRVMTALLFLEHGTMKLLDFPPSEFSPPLFSLFGAAGVLELVGGLLLIAGLFTRPVALILSGEMAVAYFMAHAPHSFFPIVNHGEAAILFCFVFSMSPPPAPVPGASTIGARPEACRPPRRPRHEQRLEVRNRGRRNGPQPACRAPGRRGSRGTTAVT